MIHVSVDSKGVRERIERVKREITGTKVRGALLKDLLSAYETFYTGKNSKFWAQFAPSSPSGFKGGITENAVYLQLGGYPAAILLHKLHGGPVNANPGKALAIPLTPQARQAGSPSRGKTPELFIFKSIRTNKAFLARRWRGRGASKKKLELWYILLKSVTHRAFPDSMPSRKTILQRSRRFLARYIRDRLRLK